MATKKRALPKERRQYHSIVGIDSGLDYSSPSTMIGETFTPRCEEVTFKDKTVMKSYGADFFASTNTTYLLGVVMFGKQYIKNDEITEAFLVHTTTNVYVYNTTTLLLECVTDGEVVEDCEDVWAVNANATCAVVADARKGTYSIAVTVAAGFTTGVAAYENFTAKDLSAYTHLHLFIKSSIATIATNIDIRVSEQNAGGGGASYEDVSVPALAAGVWTEVSVAFGGASATRDAVLSISLVLAADIGACVINVDDVMATTEGTGDEDNNICAITVNDYYVYSNGIVPLKYWDMNVLLPNFIKLPMTTPVSFKAMALIGERLCGYGVPNAPRRAQWTVVGGLSIPPVVANWTGAGSGNTDLDSVFGDDVIQTAHKLGNYVVLYGKKTIAMQEYTGKTPDDPYSFYVRMAGIGTPSERGVANLGDYHVVMGWDDVYIYRGGTDIESIGDKVSGELFDLINPTYIHRSFCVYLPEQYEVRIYFPLIGSTTPDCYFTYSLSNKSWSRGSRSYTGFGSYERKATAATWDTVGTATTTWDEMATRWDDVANERLSPLNIYGDGSGIVYQDNASLLNNGGVAIDGWWETKDFVVSEYRRSVTNWMSLHFEASGDTITVYYSTDLGESWSDGVVVTLTSAWKKYRYDLNVNSPQIRFKFRNSTMSETFELREVEFGYITASDRGVG